MGGLPRILDENHHSVVPPRMETPFLLVGRITIVGGVHHSLTSGNLIEISSSKEEEVEASSDSYRSVTLALVHNEVGCSRPPSYIE
jgi:hypothetical protein